MAIDPVAVIRAMAEVVEKSAIQAMVSVEAAKKEMERMYRRSEFHELFGQIREEIGRDRLDEGEECDLAAYIVLLFVGPRAIWAKHEKTLADELRVLRARLRRHHKAAVKACHDRLSASWREARALRKKLARARKKALLAPEWVPVAKKIEKDLRRAKERIDWIDDRLGDPANLMREVALAYLNGWKRATPRKESQNALPDWDETPTRAWSVFRTYIENTVKTALAWFRKHTEIPLGAAPDYELSVEIYDRISTGTCRCPMRLRKASLSVKHTKFSYRQRKKKCLGQHRLSAWRPEETNLWAFLGRAVTGALGKRIQRSNIESGMFWDRLDKSLGGTNKLPRLYLGRVARWVCPICYSPSIYCRCSEQKKAACRRVPSFKSHDVKRILTRFWIVDRFLYVQRPAVFCHNLACGNFYPNDQRDECPWCGQRRDTPAPCRKALDLRKFPVHHKVWFPIPFRNIHEIQVDDIDHL